MKKEDELTIWQILVGMIYNGPYGGVLVNVNSCSFLTLAYRLEWDQICHACIVHHVVVYLYRLFMFMPFISIELYRYFLLWRDTPLFLKGAAGKQPMYGASEAH